MSQLDATPKPAAGRQVIESYGGGGFKVAGARHQGSIIVLPDQTIAWPVAAAADVSTASLDPLLQRAAGTRILVVGCGAAFALRPAGLDTALRAAGITVEWMDTGAACRTFNVLLLEDREVAAALIAIE
jgi:uncharacterized protein